MNRRGFGLTELIVAMVIAGVIGIALTRLVINQARFVATQDGMMRARSSARAALNLLSYELRTVSGGTGGVFRATLDSVDVVVPYAFGVACGNSGGYTILRLIPPDSATWANTAPTTSGYAYLDNAGVWQAQDWVTTRSSTGSSLCATSGVTTWPGGVVWQVSVPQVSATLPPQYGTVYLYQKIRYAFAPSVQLPGRRALWRTTLADGVREELVAPFDTTAQFNFLVGPMLAVRTTAPTVLDSITGLRLKLNAQSEDPPQGRTAPLLFRVTSDIIFQNHDN